MEIIPNIKILQQNFEEKFNTFDYDFYQDILSERTINSHGIVTGSCLIKEVATLSSFFVSKQLKDSLDVLDVVICAFEGWNLSLNHISQKKTEAEIYQQLRKVAKIIFKQYKRANIKLTLAQVAWIVFCCAMIKEKLYSSFNYNMISVMIDDTAGEPKINVAFTLV